MFAGVKTAVAGAQQAVQQQMAPAPPPPPPVWHTRLGQCDEQAPVNPDWLYSFCLLPCAAAQAKSKVDQSHVCYNFLCWTPTGGYSYIREAYGIEGVCGDDMCYGSWCMPCTTRRMYTESKIRGHLTGPYNANSGAWNKSLFDCSPVDMCSVFCCGPCVAHEIRQKMQPRAVSCWFDFMCIPPTAWYGQVRNTFGIASDFGVAEDIFVSTFCFPCALIRARDEVTHQMTSAGGSLANTLMPPQAKAAMAVHGAMGGNAAGGYSALR